MQLTVYFWFRCVSLYTGYVVVVSTGVLQQCRKLAMEGP